MAVKSHERPYQVRLPAESPASPVLRGVPLLGQLRCRVERRFGLLACTPVLSLGNRRRVGADVVVDAGPGVVDLRVTPPTESDRYFVARRTRAVRGDVGIREVMFLE